MEKGERSGSYNLVTTLSGLNVTDFTHFDGESEMSKRFLMSEKQRFQEEKQKEGGSKLCVCVCMLLALVCVCVDFLCGGWDLGPCVLVG